MLKYTFIFISLFIVSISFIGSNNVSGDPLHITDEASNINHSTVAECVAHCSELHSGSASALQSCNTACNEDENIDYDYQPETTRPAPGITKTCVQSDLDDFRRKCKEQIAEQRRSLNKECGVIAGTGLGSSLECNLLVNGEPTKLVCLKCVANFECPGTSKCDLLNNKCVECAGECEVPICLASREGRISGFNTDLGKGFTGEWTVVGSDGCRCNFECPTVTGCGDNIGKFCVRNKRCTNADGELYHYNASGRYEEVDEGRSRGQCYCATDTQCPVFESESDSEQEQEEQEEVEEPEPQTPSQCGYVGRRCAAPKECRGQTLNVRGEYRDNNGACECAPTVDCPIIIQPAVNVSTPRPSPKPPQFQQPHTPCDLSTSLNPDEVYALINKMPSQDITDPTQVTDDQDEQNVLCAYSKAKIARRLFIMATGVVSVGALGVSGYFRVTSLGNPPGIRKSNLTLIGAVVGLMVMLAAISITRIALSLLGTGG